MLSLLLRVRLAVAVVLSVCWKLYICTGFLCAACYCCFIIIIIIVVVGGGGVFVFVIIIIVVIIVIIIIIIMTPKVYVEIRRTAVI